MQSLLGNLLDRPLAELAGADREALLGSLERFLAAALAGFLSSRSFIHGARGLINDAVRRLSGLTLAERNGAPAVQGTPGLRRAGLLEGRPWLYPPSSCSPLAHWASSP